MAGIIGTIHLSDNPALFEVVRKNTFEFVVTDLDGIMRAGMTGNESNAYIPNAQEILRLSVNKAFVPHFSQSIVEIKRGNSTIKYAGVPQFEDGTIQINDYIGADTLAVLMAWQNLSYNVETEKVGAVDTSPYKKDCYLIEYSPDLRKVRTFILEGCWISKIDSQEFSSDDGEKNQIGATITYDRARIDTSEMV